MITVRRVINGTFSEENALINVDTNEVIAKGDYYHDKITEYIDGIMFGFKFAGFECKELEDIEVKPYDDLFEICDFYNDTDDRDE